MERLGASLGDEGDEREVSMKIGMYLRHFPADRQLMTGGTSKAVHGLASGLADHGASVTVLCEGEEAFAVRSDNGYIIHSFVRSGRSPFAVSHDLTENLLLGRSGFDVVVLNGIFSPYLSTLGALLRRANVPYVVAPHDPYHPNIFRKRFVVKRPYWYLYERRLLARARAIQVLDSRHGRYIESLGIHTPTFEVPNGFLDSDVPPETPQLTQRADGRVRALYLGRVDSYNKGLDLLLAAVQSLPEIWLTIQGPDWGDRGDLVRTSRKLGIGNRVAFALPDFDRTASSIIAEYEILCLPSRFEGFGLSALEAMLSSRVVLASDIAGVSGHVRSSGCGVCVSPETSSISAGLRTLLDRRESWPTMGSKGRRYAMHNLRWRDIAGRALRAYQSVLD